MGIHGVIRGKETEPPRIVTYGCEGGGKSTMGSKCPAPIFIQTEDGLGQIGADRFPLATSFEDVVSQLNVLISAPHEYATVVIDSLDWLERLIFNRICQEFGPVKFDSIEKVDGGYGKGYIHALKCWHVILELLNRLRKEKHMMVFLIAHAKCEKFEQPGESPVDRFTPRLNKHADALITEWADAVLFAGWKFSSTVKENMNKRILRTASGPHCKAKNRYNLPEEIDLSWGALSEQIFRENK